MQLTKEINAAFFQAAHNLIEIDEFRKNNARLANAESVIVKTRKLVDILVKHQFKFMRYDSGAELIEFIYRTATNYLLVKIPTHSVNERAILDEKDVHEVCRVFIEHSVNQIISDVQIIKIVDELLSIHIDHFYNPPRIVREDPHVYMMLEDPSTGNMFLEEFSLTDKQIDIQKHYNDDFEPHHKKIVDKLSADVGSGLVLLHGEPGTGKTVYIKHLTKLLPEKTFIFFPREYIKLIGSPSFLGEMLRLKGSIIVLEDAEELLLDRTEFDNKLVHNILNITDGMLSDLLNLKVICTFNCKEEHIDNALRRKGRLITNYKFDKLSAEKTQVLATEAGKNIVGAATLAEIYGD